MHRHIKPNVSVPVSRHASNKQRRAVDIAQNLYTQIKEGTGFLYAFLLIYATLLFQLMQNKINL